MKTATTLDQARAAKKVATEIFARLTAVSGVGIARFGAGYGLKVNLSERPAKNVSLPTEVGGVPVRVEVVGRIKARKA